MDRTAARGHLADGYRPMIVTMADGYIVRTGHVGEADRLVKEFHYSGRKTTPLFVVTAHEPIGTLAGAFGAAIAAVVFSPPSARWSEPVVELSRLVRREDVKISLSSLVAKAVRMLAERQEVNLIVSYADPADKQGEKTKTPHHGGIYQAGSWTYGGRRATGPDGFIFDGKFVPRRTVNSLYGTSDLGVLRQRFPGRRIEPPQSSVSKHIYWRALDGAGKRKAARLGLESLPYPRPDESLASEVTA